MSEEQRLQKLLAAAGLGSRRYCEELIAEGRVTVGDQVATLGDRATPDADVRVDGERINIRPDLHYVVLNKPRGVVSTAQDPEGRPTVLDLVNLSVRLFPVGRLDKETEGLLLLTNDGDLAHRLMHSSFEVPRVYLALVNGPVRRDTLERLRAGVALEDGLARPSAVRVVDENDGRTLLEVTMTEGRNREVRRLVGAVDLMLERLARVAYGGVEMGELRQGKWRFLNQAEIGMLFRAVEDGPRRPRPARRPRGRGGRS